MLLALVTVVIGIKFYHSAWWLAETYRQAKYGSLICCIKTIGKFTKIKRIGKRVKETAPYGIMDGSRRNFDQEIL